VSTAAISDDWPGVFAATVEAQLHGRAMFLVADNGSIEDPHLFPLPNPQDGCPASDFDDHRARDEGCFDLAQHTGTRLAVDILATVQSGMEEVAPHPLTAHIDQFYVPLQNQLFLAAFASGLFAHRTAATATACADSNNRPTTCFLTEVGLLDFGPQLEMLVNPGEAYPALIEGTRSASSRSPARSGRNRRCRRGTRRPRTSWRWGWATISSATRFPHPAGTAAAPCTWIPAATAATPDPTDSHDPLGNYHKLESESVGPDTGNLIAQRLAALADAVPDPPGNFIESGRFITSSGTFTRKGAGNPVGMWVLPKGVTSFSPGTGTVIALPGISAFGSVPVNLTGQVMDFDGRTQAAPDINTRGMIVHQGDGSVARYFMDPYAVLTGQPPGPPRLASQASPQSTVVQLPATAPGFTRWPAILAALAVLVVLTPRRSRL